MPGRTARPFGRATDRISQAEHRWRFMAPAVLLLLRAGPAHGYDLVKRMPGVFPGRKPPDGGSVYKLLRSLEAEGAVRSYWDQTPLGPPRRMYALTGTGCEQLEAWHSEVMREVEALHGFLDRYESCTPAPARDGE